MILSLLLLLLLLKQDALLSVFKVARFQLQDIPGSRPLYSVVYKYSEYNYETMVTFMEYAHLDDLFCVLRAVREHILKRHRNFHWDTKKDKLLKSFMRQRGKKQQIS